MVSGEMYNGWEPYQVWRRIKIALVMLIILLGAHALITLFGPS